jgi:hypothetical protein
MALLFLLCSSLFSSNKTDKFPSWVSRLDPSSSDYVNQLYCGTVSRSITYLTDDKKPADSEGFEKGLAKIIAVYESNLNHRPILNEIEVKWLSYRCRDIEVLKGIRNIVNLCKPLLAMTFTINRGISFASL